MLVLRAPKAASTRLPVSVSARSPQSQCTLFHGLALKINYTAEVRGKNKGQSICVRASGQAHGAAGECTDNGIYHRDGHYTNTRSGYCLSLKAPEHQQHGNPSCTFKPLVGPQTTFSLAILAPKTKGGEVKLFPHCRGSLYQVTPR